ncbi:MAG TPA: hypothetical protein VK731_06950 [Candidatus Cybelea sp.]|nr:hypothetical protein [Candidatus Cybelea sp.]
MKAIEVTKATSLKELVRLANQESEVVLMQDSKPVARVLPIGLDAKSPEGTLSRRELGLHRGAWSVSDDFDQPLADTFWLDEE